MGITGAHGYKQGGDTKDNIPDWREWIASGIVRWRKLQWFDNSIRRLRLSHAMRHGMSEESEGRLEELGPPI